MAKRDSRPVTILKTIFVMLLASGFLFIISDACGGYAPKINKLEECQKGKNVFQIEKVKAVLSKDCVASGEGCIDIPKDVKSCDLIYSVQKKGLPVPFKGKHDLCKEISKRAQEPEIQKRLKKAKIDPTCPLNKTKLCVPLGENMDVSKYKQQFAMFEGRYNGSFTLDCDCGKSCFKFDVEFGKK